jgi:hypothetical protein
MLMSYRGQSWAGHVARKNASRNLVGETSGKLGRPTRKEWDNIKMDIRQVGCEDGRSMELVEVMLIAGFGIRYLESSGYTSQGK